MMEIDDDEYHDDDNDGDDGHDDDYDIRLSNPQVSMGGIGILAFECPKLTFVLGRRTCYSNKKTGQRFVGLGGFCPVFFCYRRVRKNCSELDGCTKNLTFENTYGLLRVGRVRWMHENK